MQFCAILSQIHKHKDALTQAKEAVKLNHLLINDLRELCLFYIKKEDISLNNPPLHFNSQSVQDFEKKTGKKLRNNNFSSNQSYQSGTEVTKSLPGKNNVRNRSFSSFLSQQEAYGGIE